MGLLQRKRGQTVTTPSPLKLDGQGNNRSADAIIVGWLFVAALCLTLWLAFLGWLT